MTFYIHVDGAWGGYFAATLWDINGNQMEVWAMEGGTEKQSELGKVGRRRRI